MNQDKQNLCSTEIPESVEYCYTRICLINCWASMDRDAAIELVNVVLDYQYDMIWLRRHSWGMNNVEFLFVETTRLLIEHGLRDWAVGAVEQSIDRGYEANGGSRPRPPGFLLHEYIMFLAHRTRWPEFSALASRLRGSPKDLWLSNRLTCWSNQLEAALRDDWEDREFYVSFSDV